MIAFCAVACVALICITAFTCFGLHCRTKLAMHRSDIDTAKVLEAVEEAKQRADLAEKAFEENAKRIETVVRGLENQIAIGR